MNKQELLLKKFKENMNQDILKEIYNELGMEFIESKKDIENFNTVNRVVEQDIKTKATSFGRKEMLKMHKTKSKLLNNSGSFNVSNSKNNYLKDSILFGVIEDRELVC